MRLLLLQLCTFISFSYVAAFFQLPFFAAFFRGLSSPQEPSDEYNRVLKLIEDSAATQKDLVKTQKDLVKIQIDLTTAQTKTDKQLRLLINYNSNRDEQLEKLYLLYSIQLYSIYIVDTATVYNIYY